MSFKRGVDPYKKLKIGGNVRFTNSNTTIILPYRKEQYTVFECWQHLCKHILSNESEHYPAVAVTETLIQLQDDWKLDPDSAPFIHGGTIIEKDGTQWVCDYKWGETLSPINSIK